jgi:hypothetical protein
MKWISTIKGKDRKRRSAGICPPRVDIRKVDVHHDLATASRNTFLVSVKIERGEWMKRV